MQQVEPSNKAKRFKSPPVVSLTEKRLEPEKKKVDTHATTVRSQLRRALASQNGENKV